MQSGDSKVTLQESVNVTGVSKLAYLPVAAVLLAADSACVIRSWSLDAIACTATPGCAYKGTSQLASQPPHLTHLTHFDYLLSDNTTTVICN